METGRRFFLSSFAVALAGGRGIVRGTQRQPPPNLPQVPDASDSGGRPDDIPAAAPPDPKVQLRENQKNLRRDADQLLQLAKDLKDEAEKTEQTDVLSLSLVKEGRNTGGPDSSAEWIV